MQFVLSVAVISCFVFVCVSFSMESYYCTTSTSDSFTSSKEIESDVISFKANITEDEPLDRFCVVITIFARTELTLKLLEQYSELPRLSRIIIVWNNKMIAPPLKEWDELGSHSIPVHFKVQERNSLMNKMQLFPEIDTPGISL